MNDEKTTNGGGIGERLRRLRFENNLTQVEVAREISVTQQTYSRYEGGDAKPDSDTIVKFCNLYGVTADYLLGLDTAKPRIEPERVSRISDNDMDMIVERLLNRLKSDKEEL